MGKRATAIISTFGLIGLLFAWLFGKSGKEVNFFIRRSANYLLTQSIFQFFLLILDFLFSPYKLNALFFQTTQTNWFIFILWIIIDMYLIVLWLQLLFSTIKLSHKPIKGIFKFF